MSVIRKALSLFILLVGSCVTVAQLSAAEPLATYPNRQLHIIVPFSPGSITDILARVLADKLVDGAFCA